MITKVAKKLFVTATNTDIGKTYTTKLLLKEFALKGFRVGVMKPIETGVVDGYAPDATELLKLTKELNDEFFDVCLEDITPITYELPAAPFVASNNEKFDFKKIQQSISKLESRCDILIVEGAGGLLVPIDDKTMMVDLIKLLDADALLVTHCSLGCINDTLLSKNLLEQNGIKHTVVFNCRDNYDSFKDVSEPYFKAVGFEVLRVCKDVEDLIRTIFAK
jgi:dethiobiotin synthetase